MSSVRQIEANRLNAQKSTGPRSAIGKAASCINALKSGIDAKSLIIPGEIAANLEALTAEYIEEYQPATPTERCCVDILIRSDWQLRRLARVDAQIWDYEFGSVYTLHNDHPLGQTFNKGIRPFEVIQRRINATERSFKHALHELQRLQAARIANASKPHPEATAQTTETKSPTATIGFVPSTSPETGPQPPLTSPPNSNTGTFQTIPADTRHPKYAKLVVF